MKNYKNVIIFIFCLVVFSFKSSAQGVYDIFPLDTGMHYTYSFYEENKYYHLMVLLEVISDSGEVECIVLDSLQYGDTLKIWNIEQKRKLTHYIYFNPWDTTYLICDTSYYQLYEFLEGNHELECSSIVWQFPITHSSVIDSSIFRYSDFENILIAHLFQQNNDYWRDSIWFSNEAGMYRRVTERYFNPGMNHYAYKRYIQRSDITIGVKQSDGNIVKDYILYQNFPNPFNPSTRIRYQIPELSFVTLKVYDVLGNAIATIVNEEKSAGSYDIDFNGDGLTSGIYFYQLRVGNFTQTRKMMLLK